MATEFIENHPYDELQVGQSAELQRTLTRDDIVLFGKVSGDLNPTHVDPEFARGSAAGEITGHSLWSSGLISSLLGNVLPGPGTVYRKQDLAFQRPIALGDTLTARVKVIAHDGAGNSGEDTSDADFEINDPVAGVIPDKEIPSYLVITGNMPNPFSRHTTVRFGIPRDGWVNMTVYDVSGRLVARLVDGSLPAGYHTVEWAENGKVGAGIYFLKLHLGSEDVTRKVVISR